MNLSREVDYINSRLNQTDRGNNDSVTQEDVDDLDRIYFLLRKMNWFSTSLRVQEFAVYFQIIIDKEYESN